MTPFEFVLVTTLILGQAPASAAAPAGFERARTLYDAASYEEALSLLITIEDESNVAEVEHYRALCLLALGRSAEAERALERIVVKNPFYRIEVSDVSPRLVLLFRDVRQRMLPAVVRNLYARGKASYDSRRYPQALAQLQEVVTLLSEDEPAALSEGLLELRQLAEGFLSLSFEGASAAESAAEALARSAAPSFAPPLAVRHVPDPNRIYSIQDRSVLPPVEVIRRVPPGVEIAPGESPRLYQGLIEVVIDDKGRVQSAEVRRSVTTAYDAALVEATRDWRFEPASLDGTPVQYKKFFEIIVWGMSSRAAFGRP